MVKSQYKANCDFEMASQLYISGIGRKYIFSQLAINTKQQCYLKIALRSKYDYKSYSMDRKRGIILTLLKTLI